MRLPEAKFLLLEFILHCHRSHKRDNVHHDFNFEEMLSKFIMIQWLILRIDAHVELIQ